MSWRDEIKGKEYAAIESIKKLLDDLPMGGRVRSAFEGCIDMAMDNMTYGKRDSMKESLEGLRAEAKDLAKKLDAMQQKVVSDDDLYYAWELARDKAAESRERVRVEADAMADWSIDPASEAFKLAVIEYKAAKESAEYYEGLTSRLAAAYYSGSHIKEEHRKLEG